MSAQMQKQKPAQAKPTEDVGKSVGQSQQSKLKSPDLPNKGKGKEVRFETTPPTSANPLSSAEMSQVDFMPPVVYPEVPKGSLHIPEPDPVYDTLPTDETQPSGPLSDMPPEQHRHRKARTELGSDDVRPSRSKKGPRSLPDTRKKRSGRSDDGRSSRASPVIAISDIAGNSKAFRQMPAPLLRLKVLNDVANEERIVREENEGESNLRSEGWDEDLEFSDDNQTLLRPSKRRKPKQIHKQIWSEHNVLDNVKALMYDGDVMAAKNINAANQIIKDINKENGWDPDLGVIPVRSYNAVLELLNDPMGELQKNQDEAAWSKWAIHKDAINIINLNFGLPDTFNLPRDFLERKIGIPDRARIRRDTDDEASPDPSSESDYSVESFYRGKSHHAPSSRSSRRSRRTSSQSRRERSRHDTNSENDDGHHSQRSRSSGQTRRARSQGTRDDDDDHNRDNDSNEGGAEGEESEAIEEEGSEADSDLDGIDSDLDDSPSGLRKAIEKKYDIPMIGTVLGYRRCGPFYYQCLVQYGDNDAPTYRMVPGRSAGPWNPEKTENLVTGQRGKLRTGTDWTYKEHDILRIAGVAWQPYDEDSLNPLASLNPKNFQTTPPSTYVVVIWKNDNKRTFETRGSMRRILGNARSGAPDLAILHRARVQEKKYLEARTRAQSPKKAKTSQQKKGHTNDMAHRSREESETVRTADVRKGDSRKSDSRKSDSRKGNSRKANSRTQSKTPGASSQGSSMRLFYDDAPVPSSSKGQHSELRDPPTRDEMLDMMFRYFQEKAPL